MSARKPVEDVLSPAMTRAVWSSDYRPALPISVQTFDLSAILPAVFYMFRFGRRRGQGKFVEAFGRAYGTASQRRRSVTVNAIAEKLADGPGGMLCNFDGKAAQAILGDLLLCYCLDNARYALGRDKQVQRIAPTHYMSSWIDLPHRMAAPPACAGNDRGASFKPAQGGPRGPNPCRQAPQDLVSGCG